MKIEQTKMWSEFIAWYVLRNYGVPILEFIHLPFEFQEGVYRAFLREKGIDIDIGRIKTTIKIRGENYGRIEYTYIGSTKQIKILATFDTYEQAFMNLVTEIFNKP